MPENLLRIELRFSAPLRIPFSMDNVKLLDGDGRVIERALLDLPLPSADGTRVTILLSPARLKTGLAENLALGRALHQGSTVTLVVDDPQLAKPVRKTWRVTRFQPDPPDPSRWTLKLPVVGTREALQVDLHKPLSSTAEDFIAIRGPDGNRVPGIGRLENEEMLWQFTPDRAWVKGVYAVVTNPMLEDPEGNRTCESFEAVGASRIQCEGTVRLFRGISPRERS